MRIERWLAVVGVAMVAAGCGNGGEEAGEIPEPTVIGEWNPGDDSGENEGQFLLQPWTRTTLRFLRLDEGGTGFAILQNYQVSANDRVSLTWSQVDGLLALDVPALSFFRQLEVGFQGSHLSLRDPGTGESFSFWRPAYQEIPIVEADLAEYLTAFSSPIHPATTLVGDGVKLWYEIYGYQLVEYDATTATVHPADPTYSHPVAMQGGDFWLTCTACPNSQKLQRRTQANQLVTELDLANEIEGTITSAHWDGGSLWIADAYEADGDLRTKLKRFNPAVSEPPQVRYVGTRFEAFTFHDGRLFAITYLPTPVLIEVNGDDQAVQSLELPEDVHWQGLASKGGKLHMLGGGVNGFPVTVTVENP